MNAFKKNQIIKLRDGKEIKIISMLGGGGQGNVYKVLYDGEERALKWYHSSYLKEMHFGYKKFYKNLCSNVLSGPPSKDFLWPMAVTVSNEHKDSFGYIMELRPSRFSEFTKFIKGKEHMCNTNIVITTAINMVNAFQSLHKKGLSYQDLSPGNFFIDKTNGDILICDNDNVVTNGENIGIAGTPGYISPEILLGYKNPSTDTDLFSLSVILFELFFLSHPLDGANSCRYPCLTPEIEKELYAVHPVYVMSKVDRSNAPVRGVFTNLINLYPIYPKYFHESFEQAFGPGLKDSKSRLSESDWQKVLYRLIDDSVECPNCHEINFASMGSSGKLACTNCNNLYNKPYGASINGYDITMDNCKLLFDYHVNFGNRENILGTFLESKKQLGLYGLRNESNLIWSAKYPNNQISQFQNGQVAMLIPGTELMIGNTKMTIHP